MRSRFLSNLLLAVVTSLLFLAFLESASRLKERLWPPPRVAGYIWDWRVEWNGDFPAAAPPIVPWPHESINGDGVRDRWHAVERTEHTRRLVVLGDSVTFGAGLTPEEAYPQLLEARLRARGERVEVFNMANLGWSTRQERIAYLRLARRYRPDQVILGVCLNDIPELQNNLSRPSPWLASLHARSALLRFLLNAPGREIARVEELFSAPDSRKAREALGRFFDEVRALRRDVEADGAKLGLIVFPFTFQLEPDASPPVVQQRILGFCRLEGVPCLDLLPRLQTLGADAFLDYDHLTARGTRAVVDALLAERLVERQASDDSVLRGCLAARGLSEKQPAELWSDRRQPASASTSTAIAACLGNLSGRVRAAAAWALGLRDDIQVAPRLALQQLARSDSEAEVRREALRTLAATDPDSATIVLLDALDDRNQAVRWAAAELLARRTPSPIAVPRLVRQLQSSDSFVRSYAAWALGEIGPAAREAVPTLLDVLRREAENGPSGAAQALARLGAAEAVPVLVDVLTQGNPEARWRAAAGLSDLGFRAGAAVRALESALRDPDARVRLHATRALGQVGASARNAVPVLRRALAEDSEPRVRAEAAMALGQTALATADSVPALIRGLRDPEPSVRAACAHALGNPALREGDAVEPLIVALRDRARDVRVEAATALGHFGPLARPAIPALREATRDERARVRRAAEEALRRLGEMPGAGAN